MIKISADFFGIVLHIFGNKCIIITVLFKATALLKEEFCNRLTVLFINEGENSDDREETCKES